MFVCANCPGVSFNHDQSIKSIIDDRKKTQTDRNKAPIPKNQNKTLSQQQTNKRDVHVTGYREVEVVLSTHAIGALAMADFVMAAKIDGVEVDYSPKWLVSCLAAVSVVRVFGECVSEC